MYFLGRPVVTVQMCASLELCDLPRNGVFVWRILVHCEYGFISLGTVTERSVSVIGYT